VFRIAPFVLSWSSLAPLRPSSRSLLAKRKTRPIRDESSHAAQHTTSQASKPPGTHALRDLGPLLLAPSAQRPYPASTVTLITFKVEPAVPVVKSGEPLRLSYPWRIPRPPASIRRRFRSPALPAEASPRLRLLASVCEHRPAHAAGAKPGQKVAPDNTTESVPRTQRGNHRAIDVLPKRSIQTPIARASSPPHGSDVGSHALRVQPASAEPPYPLVSPALSGTRSPFRSTTVRRRIV